MEHDREALAQVQKQVQEWKTKTQALKEEVRKNQKIGHEIAMETPGA